jgi:hypothetical protein
MQFRDAETGQWRYIVDKKYTLMSQNSTEEQKEEYDKLGLYPLHDMADRGNAMIIHKESDFIFATDAIFTAQLTLDNSASTEEDGLQVKTEYQLLIIKLNPNNWHILDMIYKLALRLRNDKLTDTHLGIFYRFKEESNGSSDSLDKKMSEDEEFKASLEALEQKMKDLIIEVCAEDEKFVQVVKSAYGDSSLKTVWLFIRNWFRHDYIRTPLSEEQVWFVD